MYAGALHQLTMGHMGWSGLGSFMSPFIVGADRLRLLYFHLESCGMSVVLRFIVFLIWFWKVFVGFVVDVWELLLLSMKACIFVLYCCVGSMTKEFPLSADVFVASFSMGFFLSGLHGFVFGLVSVSGVCFVLALILLGNLEFVSCGILCLL